MADSKHTPGPWETDHVGIYGCKDGIDESIMLASVYADGGLDQDEHLHNADLIAAAPDLLAALKELRAVCPLGSAKVAAALDAAGAAIAKAEAL